MTAGLSRRKGNRMTDANDYAREPGLSLKIPDRMPANDFLALVTNFVELVEAVSEEMTGKKVALSIEISHEHDSECSCKDK